MRAASCFLRTLAALVLGAAVLRADDLPAGKADAPQSVDLRPQLEEWGLLLRSQGARGTCSVFATVGALEFAVSRHYGRGTALSVEFLNWASNAAMRDPRDGGFFHELLRGFEEHGVCPEEDMPYQAQFDAALAPADAAMARAREIRGLGLRVHWINPWKPEAGLSDEHLREIKAVLARGYPVAAGSGHSRLVVGYCDDGGQPGGGTFVLQDSAAVAYITMTYEQVKQAIGDVFWVEAPGKVPDGREVVDGTPGALGLAKKTRDPATGITFILVEPGTFRMGAGDGEVDGFMFDDEYPQHAVEITRPFHLGETEVTVGQWRAFALRTGYRTEAEESGSGGHTHDSVRLGDEPRADAIWSKPLPLHEYGFDDTHPVTQVSWNDARAFCQEYGYRLPSEAEWEYACRAGTSTAYWWGDDEMDGRNAGNFQDRLERASDPWHTTHPSPFGIFPHADGRAFTAPVGAYAANPWGFRDMLGNVEEWCADTGGVPSIRGGSWFSGPRSCRSASRSSSFFFEQSDTTGFRVAR